MLGFLAFLLVCGAILGFGIYQRLLLFQYVWKIYCNSRDSYKWEKRRTIPNLIKKLGDMVFSIESEQGTVDCPLELHESIHIKSALLHFDGNITQVAERINDLKSKNLDNKGFFRVYLDDLVPTFRKQSDMWSIYITYVGHANGSGKISAEEFAVKYNCVPDGNFLFPPFNARESISKGLGNRKILQAISNNQDVTTLAKLYGGLRRNFYDSLQADNVCKHYMPCGECKVIVSEKGNTKAIQLGS